MEQGDGDLQDFIHTSNFVLVDKEKQIRGLYDGTDAKELKRIIEDIKVLMNWVQLQGYFDYFSR